MSYGSSASSAESAKASSYRIKFDKNEFQELLGLAQPRIIYKVSNFYYFSFDGFVMYSNKVNDGDLTNFTILRGTEFSNISWAKS